MRSDHALGQGKWRSCRQLATRRNQASSRSPARSATGSDRRAPGKDSLASRNFVLGSAPDGAGSRLAVGQSNRKNCCGTLTQSRTDAGLQRHPSKDGRRPSRGARIRVQCPYLGSLSAQTMYPYDTPMGMSRGGQTKGPRSWRLVRMGTPTLKIMSSAASAERRSYRQWRYARVAISILSTRISARSAEPRSLRWPHRSLRCQKPDRGTGRSGLSLWRA